MQKKLDCLGNLLKLTLINNYSKILRKIIQIIKFNPVVHNYKINNQEYIFYKLIKNKTKTFKMIK